MKICGILWIFSPPMVELTPVILCGGSGTRLWPLSRKSYPKQFVPLMGDQSLFQSALLRMSGQDFTAPLIITNSDFRFIVTEQMARDRRAARLERGPVVRLRAGPFPRELRREAISARNNRPAPCCALRSGLIQQTPCGIIHST